MDSNNNLTSQTVIEDIKDDSFSYHGYQVVRREFFAHIYEPSITFSNCKITVNTACLKRLPHVDYVQFLVNSKEKKLIIRPCQEDDKDSCLWCCNSNFKRKSKQITCRIFFAKVTELMGWNPEYRYKMLGKLLKSGDEYLFQFDLKDAETYLHIITDSNRTKASRTPIYPAEWHNQFGLPVEEHRKLLQINIFDGYTVFGLKNSDNESNMEDS